ncbi:MAG TPA: exonuclease SbcCD subunit D [Treponemataceae bacterium]|nr:exonuclease SbcCD subunit D [Treponemataceae bacterium]
MLKILHTGDLHLGKIFYERSLLEDQKHILGQITQELQKEFDANKPYSALVITGDIYDRAIAPAKAISLLDSFLVSTHTSFPTLAICIISGNHDSAKRMSFGTRLLESHNIHICTQAKDCTKPVFLYKPAKKEQKTVETLPIAGVLYQLPFLYPGDFTTPEDAPLYKQSELVKEGIRLITEQHKKLQKSKPELNNVPVLLSAHLTTLPKSITSNTTTENSDAQIHTAIGSAGYVSPKVFSFFDYVALGHIHKPLKPASNAEYAGSPLETSFKNTGKNMPPRQKHFLHIHIDINAKVGDLFEQSRLKTVKVPIEPLHPVLRLEGRFSEFEEGTFNAMEKFGFSKEYLKNAYLEITCTDTILVENPLARLQTMYPFVMAIHQRALTSTDDQQHFTQRQELFEDTTNLGKIDNAKLFTAFIADTFSDSSEDEWKEAKKLFLEML